MRAVREAGLTPSDRALRESDLRVLLDVVRAGYDDEPGQAMPSAVLHALAKLIPCASITFCELDVRDQVVLTDQEVSDAAASASQVAPIDEVFWAEFWNCRFCSYPERAGDLRSVVRLSDFYSRRKLHATAMWAEFTGHWVSSTRCWYRCQPRPGTPGGSCSSAARPIPTSPNENASRLNCCDPTCMPPGKTPNAAGPAFPASPAGNGKCCTW